MNEAKIKLFDMTFYTLFSFATRFKEENEAKNLCRGGKAKRF